MPTPTICLETARGENVRSTELTLEKESCMVFGGRKMGALIWSSSESNCYETNGCARIGMFVLRRCVRMSIFLYVCVCMCQCICLYLYMGEGFHDSVLHSGLRACVRAQIQVKARHGESKDEKLIRNKTCRSTF